jgi:carbamoyltransferase
MYKTTNCSTLEWNVFSGPQLIINKPYNGWQMSDCNVAQLAKLLFQTKEPVVYLHGKSELGPRSLGHRSIVADATNIKMKNILNVIKNREEYRPISPMCLEEKASKYFLPGTKSQYMLFDHIVKDFWLDKIPAIVHLDKSARLQTVSENDDNIFYDLLMKYEKISKIPILCNTSANYKGSGFFPDIYSATKWGKTNYVWCDNVVYTKKVKIKFDV